ncbi:MAG: hypothetical protein HYU39_06440 [Thaumarchaeota archaeon]|nr:hypothetical protein [Nitrososphaerota archaeon]
MQKKVDLQDDALNPVPLMQSSKGMFQESQILLGVGVQHEIECDCHLFLYKSKELATHWVLLQTVYSIFMTENIVLLSAPELRGGDGFPPSGTATGEIKIAEKWTKRVKFASSMRKLSSTPRFIRDDPKDLSARRGAVNRYGARL